MRAAMRLAQEMLISLRAAANMDGAAPVLSTVTMQIRPCPTAPA